MKGDPMDGEPTRYMRSHAEDDLGCPMRSEEVTVHWPRRDAPGGMGWESRQDSEGAPPGSQRGDGGMDQFEVGRERMRQRDAPRGIGPVSAAVLEEVGDVDNLATGRYAAGDRCIVLVEEDRGPAARPIHDGRLPFAGSTRGDNARAAGPLGVRGDPGVA